MRTGHIEQGKNRITGNRIEYIVNVYEMTKEERIEHFETCDILPRDIVNAMYQFGIPYKYFERLQNYQTCDILEIVIESNGLIFFFQDNDLIYCGKKINILDELREKYNLPY